jgi:hypothetical protein
LAIKENTSVGTYSVLTWSSATSHIPKTKISLKRFHLDSFEVIQCNVMTVLKVLLISYFQNCLQIWQRLNEFINLKTITLKKTHICFRLVMVCVFICSCILLLLLLLLLLWCQKLAVWIVLDSSGVTTVKYETAGVRSSMDWVD